MQTQPYLTLNNGIAMPQLGLGVYEARDGDEVTQVVKEALTIGYRLIDTAAAYRNESGVGEGIRQSGIPRSDVFVTTKVWNIDHGYDTTLKAFERSLGRLGLAYVDLYLIHWPGRNRYLETWRALRRLYEEGRCRAIGVSNFEIHHLNELIEEGGMTPAVNQVEFHPLFQQRTLRQYCRVNNIAVEAWSPIMKGKLALPPLTALARKYGKTEAQIVLRWDLQSGVAAIPKTVRLSRLKENFQIFDFELAPEDMAQVNAIDQNMRFGNHPDTFLF